MTYWHPSRTEAAAVKCPCVLMRLPEIPGTASNEIAYPGQRLPG
jgi:hypothetical protein